MSSQELEQRRLELREALDFLDVVRARDDDTSWGLATSEITERTIRLLVGAGVALRLEQSFLGLKFAVILPEGPHPLNGRAKELAARYDGMTLRFDPDMRGQASATEFHNRLDLGADELIRLDPKSVPLGHERGHIENRRTGHRDFGAASPGRGPLPGDPTQNTYDRYLSYEENERFSYSLHGEAKRLLRAYLRGTPRDSAAEDRILKAAEFAPLIAGRNALITEGILRTLDAGSVLESKRVKLRSGGPLRTEFTLRIPEGDTSYLYSIDLHGPLPVHAATYVRSKAEKMRQLNPNYLAQSAVALRIARILTTVGTAREKAAVLAGLVAVTRHHFWDEPVLEDEDYLTNLFNNVASDRWRRYQHLE